MSIASRYINRGSSTLVALINILKGISAIWVLYQLLSFLFANVKGISEIGKVWSLIEGTLSGADLIFDVSSLRQTQSDAAWVSYFVLVMLILFIGGQVLSLIDSVALLTLRFGHKGASAVRVVHRIYNIIYLIAAILCTVLFGYIIISIFSSPVAHSPLSIVVSASSISLIIMAVIIVGLLFMFAFYEADIAKAMKTVGFEISNDYEDPDFRRTSLSGLSITFGIFMLIFACIGLYVGIRAVSSGANAVTLFSGILFALYAIKYFAVSGCYRNLSAER